MLRYHRTAVCAIVATLATAIAATRPADAAIVDVEHTGGGTLTGALVYSNPSGVCANQAWTYSHQAGAAFMYSTSGVWFEGPVTQADMSGGDSSGSGCGAAVGTLDIAALSGYFALTTGHFSCGPMSGAYQRIGGILLGNVDGQCSINEWFPADTDIELVGVLTPAGPGVAELAAAFTVMPACWTGNMCGAP